MWRYDTPVFRAATVILNAVVLPLVALSVVRGIHRSWEAGTSTGAQWFFGGLLLLLILYAYAAQWAARLRRRRSGSGE